MKDEKGPRSCNELERDLSRPEVDSKKINSEKWVYGICFSIIFGLTVVLILFGDSFKEGSLALAFILIMLGTFVAILFGALMIFSGKKTREDPKKPWMTRHVTMIQWLGVCGAFAILWVFFMGRLLAVIFSSINSVYGPILGMVISVFCLIPMIWYFIRISDKYHLEW
jgi:hypothetical protein